MVWTTTSASHSFSHSGLCSSAPLAAGAASPSSCWLGSPSGVAPLVPLLVSGLLLLLLVARLLVPLLLVVGLVRRLLVQLVQLLLRPVPLLLVQLLLVLLPVLQLRQVTRLLVGGLVAWLVGLLRASSSLGLVAWTGPSSWSLGRGRGPESHRPSTSPATTATCPTPHTLCFWRRTHGNLA